ncbi:hypothetical protein A0H81_01825 [Grifola frondosa]|uniref:Uncharacterized protein n=1 Tax=Grifola frondosa TaxID=5627 RepID=A0A1C7MMG2_GRIFR|nr:hypothetical protein A0H81_01825 [Grifola frondosa]
MGPGQALSVGRLSPSRRHLHVASLPSLTTPQALAGSDGHHFDLAFTPSNRWHHDAGRFSSAWMALHDAEDLKSYEQVVLARKVHVRRNGTLELDEFPCNAKLLRSQNLPQPQAFTAYGAGGQEATLCFKIPSSPPQGEDFGYAKSNRADNVY